MPGVFLSFVEPAYCLSAVSSSLQRYGAAYIKHSIELQPQRADIARLKKAYEMQLDNQVDLGVQKSLVVETTAAEV